MVNLIDDEELEDNKYAPDGRYIPRLYFLDKQGDVLAVDNSKSFPQYNYYYPQAFDVVDGMKRALKEYSGENVSTEKNADQKKETIVTEANIVEKKEKTEENNGEKVTDKKEKNAAKQKESKTEKTKTDKADEKEKKEKKSKSNKSEL